MKHYILGIYRRRRAGETVGLLAEKIEFDAPDDETAWNEAFAKLGDVDWNAHFAALSDAEKSGFLCFWTSGNA